MELEKANSPEYITIEGETKQQYRYKDIKSSVVCITNKYYWRHDDSRVVPIKTKDNKIRYYRLNSPLIARDENTGKYFLKTSFFKTEEGIYLNPESADVCKIGDKYYRKAFCVEINNRWYIKSDPQLHKCYVTGNYFLKTTGTVLSPQWYKNERNVVSRDVTTVTTVSGHLVRKDDAYAILNVNTGKVEYFHADEVPKNPKFVNVLFDFQDKTNPQEDRVVQRQALATDVNEGLQKGTVISYHIIPEGPGYYLPVALKPYFDECVETYIMPRILTKLAEVKKKINNKFSDLDDQENVAKKFMIISKPFPGKHPISRPPNSTVPVRSRTFTRTGGLQYSFGIEFETSQGLIQNEAALNELHLMAVGDRSIGAGEYVTAPLMGDNGIQLIEQACQLLNEETLVDDRCGLHVHIGSLFQPTKLRDVPNVKQAPSFSKQYLMNCVNLGALIEEELYSTLPPNREPTLYHCHSIKRFAPITDKNYATNFGAYLWGPYEWWLAPNEKCRESLWKFEPYTLGSGLNQRTQVGQWQEGRYKWLNLLPSYHEKKNKTTELRIFSGTTVFEKVYAYILTSMAFVYAADNHPEIIKPGVRLEDLFRLAFPKHENLQIFLYEFYKARKEKFNRKNIYPKLDLPFLK